MQVYKIKITNVRTYEVTAMSELEAKKKLWSRIKINEGTCLQEITSEQMPKGTKRPDLIKVG